MSPNVSATIEREIWHLDHVRCTRFGFECQDPGHLFNVGYFVGRDQARPSLLVEFLPGSTGGADTPVRCMLGRS